MDSLNAVNWADLVIRWTHVFAGILWVGTTYYFTWLDGRFSELESKVSVPPAKPEGRPEKNVWMVHSGGFYRVEKQRVPDIMPEKLHWFRWEAATTWLSGFLLLALVYYHGRQLVPPEDWPINRFTALWISLGSLIAGWLIYDLLWSSRIFKSDLMGAVICYVLIVGATYGLFRVFSPRGACIQLGAIFGTIMVCNVWMRILPAQRRMVAALKAGREPDQEEAKRAKGRSKHNTFIVLPVIILMLNQHFPVVYDWKIVSALVLVGWGVAKVLRRA